MKNAKPTSLTEVFEISADAILEIKDPKQRFDFAWALISGLITFTEYNDQKAELKLLKRLTVTIIDNYNRYLINKN